MSQTHLSTHTVAYQWQLRGDRGPLSGGKGDDLEFASHQDRCQLLTILRGPCLLRQLIKHRALWGMEIGRNTVPH